MNFIKVKNLKSGDIVDTSRSTGYTHSQISMVVSIDKSVDSRYLLNDIMTQTKILTINLISKRGISKIAFLENDKVQIIRSINEKVC